jgi:hypothetical protein
MELVEELELIMHKVEAEHRTPLGGMLRPEYYKRAKQIIKGFKDEVEFCAQTCGHIKNGNGLPIASRVQPSRVP